MEAVKDELIEQALAKSILDKSSQELRDALVAEVWAQHREELRQRATEEVNREQQAADESRRERWQAQKAEQRRALEREADQLIAEGIEHGMRDERQEFEERRQRLISQRNEARARADAAEAWIVEHIKELLPPDGRRVLLHDPEITKFRLHTLNGILSRFGLEVKARLTDTPQVVACEVGPQRWEQRSRFRLTTITPVGVIDETADEDEDAGALAEASADGEASTI
jgi:hypothetical protein